MDLLEFLEKTNSDSPRKQIVCNDGFKISIQTNNPCNIFDTIQTYPFYYCEFTGDYSTSTYEVGFPSEYDVLLETLYSTQYNEEIYSHVPFRILDIIIMAHNQINVEKTFNEEV